MTNKKVRSGLVAALFFLFLSSAFSADRSSYYRWRLQRFPNYYFLQKRYIETLAREKKSQEALLYLDALAKNPKRRWRAALLRGYWYAMQQNMDKALSFWKKAEPQLLADYHRLSEFYVKYRLYQHVVRLLRLRLQRYQGPEKAYFQLAEVLFLQGKDSQATEVVVQLLQQKKSVVWRVERLVLRLFSNVDRFRLFRKAVFPILADKKIDLKKRFFIRRVLVRLLLRFMKYQTAFQQAKLLAVDPQNHRFIYMVVVYYNHIGEYNKALALYKYIPLLSLGSDAALLRARLTAWTDPAAAFVLYKKMYAMGWRRSKVLRGLSKTCAAMQRYLDARGYLLKLGRLLKSDILLCGKYSLLLQEYASAASFFKRLFGARKDYYLALNGLFQGKYTQVVKRLRSIVSYPDSTKAARDSFELYAFLRGVGAVKSQLEKLAKGYRFLLQGQSRQAAEVFDILSRGVAGFWVEVMRLKSARLYVKSGRYKRGLQLFKALIAAKSKVTDLALYHAGMLLKYRLGRPKEGAALLFDLVAKFPRSVYLYQARKELLAK